MGMIGINTIKVIYLSSKVPACTGLKVEPINALKKIFPKNTFGKLLVICKLDVPNKNKTLDIT